MTITRFEDLTCWQKARELMNYVFDLCEKERLSKDFGTKDQIRRAAVSVMNNIAEGFGRYSNKQFTTFLDYSNASCLEVRSMSYVLLDRNYISEAEFKHLYDLTVETTKQIVGFIKYLDKNDPKKI
jgi:four helix bundle protein